MDTKIKTDDIGKLYNAVKGVGFSDLGAEDTFREKLRDEKNRRKLYDAISPKFEDVGDFDAFNERVGRSYSNPIEEKNPFNEVWKGFGGTTGFSTNYDARGIKNKNNTSLPPDKIYDFERSSVPGNVTHSPTLEYGFETIEGDQTQKNRESTRESAYALYSDIDNEYKKAYKTAGDSYDELQNGKSGFVKLVESFAESSTPSGTPIKGDNKINYIEKQKNVRDLSAAKNLLQASMDMIEQADRNAKKGSSFVKNLGYGLKDGVFDIKTWDMGMSDFADNTSLYAAAQKAERGEKLTKEEDALLTASAVNMATEAYFGSDLGRGYTAGSITAQSIPFMIEMALNPLSETGSALTKTVAKYGLKKFGKTALKSTPGKAARVATRVGGDVAGASGMAATTGSGRVAADAIRRNMGDVQYGIDENDNLRYAGTSEGDSWGEAIGKSLSSRGIENFSEMFGLYFTPIGRYLGASKVGKAIKASSVGKAMDRLSTSDFGKLVTDFEKRAKWNGTIGEWGEEQVGTVLNSLFVGDQQMSDLVDVDQQIDTFIGVSLMGGAISGVKTVGYRTPRYEATKKYNSADRKARETVGEDSWTALREDINGANQQGRTQILSDVYTSDMSQEQKRAVFDYTGRLNALDGLSRIDEKQINEGQKTVAGVELENAYMQGQQAADSDAAVKHIAKIELDRAYLGFSPEQIEALNGVENPAEYLYEHPEETDALVPFFNARAKYEGMMQGIRDGIEGKVQKISRSVDDNTHSDGNMYSAVLKTNDAPVTILTGNIVLDGNGEIDLNKSSSRFVVRGVDGKMEMRPIEDIFKIDGVQNATQLKDMLAEQVRQSEAQVQAAQIDGVRDFAPGEQFNALVGDTLIPMEVLDQNDDGTITVTDGTRQQVFSRDELQHAVNEAEIYEAPPVQQIESVPGRYEVDNEIVLNTPQGPVHGTITSLMNADGLIEVETNSPVNGRLVNMFTAEQLDEMSKLVEAEKAAEVAPDGEEVVKLESENIQEPTVPLDEKGNPLWEQADYTATSAEFSRQMGEEATNAVDLILSGIQADMKKLEKKKTSPSSEPNKVLAEIRERKELLEAMQGRIEYWTLVRRELTAPKTETDEVARDIIVSQEENISPVKIGVSKTIIEKWINTPKAEGLEDIITSPSGKAYRGHWVVVDAEALTPSHDPETLSPTLGFPTAKDGSTINDNDYSGKRADVERIAASYDARAIDNPVIVSRDGIVVSGNNRTMSGQLAARRGTDAGYMEAMPAKAAQRGIEDVSGFEHPRLVFELVEPVDYSTKLFADFNAPVSKTKNAIDIAIEAGKKVDGATIVRLTRIVSDFDTMGDFYKNFGRVREFFNVLSDAGILSAEAMPQYLDTRNNLLSMAGKEYIENTLLGNVISAANVKRLSTDGMGKVRKAILRSIPQLVENGALGEYSILLEINSAIGYIAYAKNHKFDSLSDMILSQDLFEQLPDFNKFAVVVAGKIQNGELAFKRFLLGYNEDVSAYAGGQADMFTGNIPSKEQIQKSYEKDTDRETRTAIEAIDTRTGETAIFGKNNSADDTPGTGDNATGTGEDRPAEQIISQEEKETTQYGSKNTIVSPDRYEELKKRMHGKLGQLNAGLDPEMLSIGTEMAVYHIEAGARKFADYALRMVDDLGDKIRPYLKSFYVAAQAMPEMADISSEMDSYAEVMSYDVDSIGKEKKESNTNRKEDGVTDTVGQNSPVEHSREPAGDVSGTLEEQPERVTRTSGKYGAEGVEVEGNSPEERGGRERSTRDHAGYAESGLDSTGATEDNGERATGRRNVSETPKNNRNNVIGRGDNIVPRGDAAKIKANIEAIKLVKKLAKSGEPATPEHMLVLRRYTGWGGLSAVFNETNPNYEALKNVLTEEEYDSARASTTTSFYTPSFVVSSVWDMVERLGFRGGYILEPSAGIGHFFGLMPAKVSGNSDLRGVELDNISGMILKSLYPDAKINIGGFEEQRIPNNSVDLVITNVPFGAFKVYDKYDKDISTKFDIHDYFIAKSVRKLKPGGLGVFISTTSTLDRSNALRNWVINDGNADFIGAVRLNSDTFKANAGTEASADIIIIRKRDENGKSPYAADFQDVVIERETPYQQEVKDKYGYGTTIEDKVAIMRYNKYFVEYPEFMAGEMKFGFEGGNEIRPTEQRCAPVKGIEQETVIGNFLESLPESLYDKVIPKLEKEQTVMADGTKEGGLTVIDGKAYVVQYGEPVAVDWNGNNVAGRSKLEALADYKAIKKAVDDLLSAENTDADNIEDLRKNLNRVYDAFVKRYGTLSRNNKISFLRDDVDFPAVSAIEEVKEEDSHGKIKEYKIEKSDIFSKRVINRQKELTPETVDDGIKISQYQNGKLDIAFIARMMGKNEEDIRREILSKKLGFVNPATGIVEDRNDYLSGNVRDKFTIAEGANENGVYDTNIIELAKVIPTDVPLHLIKISLGSTWVPTKVYAKFFQEEFGVRGSVVKTSGDKFVSALENIHNNQNRGKGMEGALGTELALDLMNNVETTIYTKEYDYEKGRMVSKKDAVATAQAMAKQSEIGEQFEQWVKKDGNPFAEELTTIYNNTFNAIVPKEVDVSKFEYFPNASYVKKPREHQKVGVMKALNRATLLAHEVGTGKTITLISAAMEMRRLGLAKKPVIVVQRSTYEQFVNEIKSLYPQAKVLVPSAKDLTAAQRSQLFAKIAYNDWDIVVLYHSYLDSIPDDPNRVNQYVDELIQEKLEILEEIKANNPDNIKRLEANINSQIKNLQGGKVSVKRKEKVKANAKSRAGRLLDRRTDSTMTFEQLGVDALLIDEAHNYKKLGFSTSLQNIKGVDTAASQKAQSLRLKTSYILENNGGKNVVFATGTPISNTMAEMWTFIRYLLPKSELEKYEMKNFDAFVNNFGSIDDSSEFTTSGKFRVTKRFSSFSNVPELISIWRQVADTVLTEEVGALREGVGTPRVEGGKPTDVMLDQTMPLKQVMKAIKAELERFEKLRGIEKRKNSHIPLVMFGLAKRAAIDVRLVDPDLPDDPKSKLNEAVREIIKDLGDTQSYKGTVAVFCDAYQSSDKRFNVFEDIKQKLVENGIQEEQIAIINDYNNDSKKASLFSQINAGSVRVIMGTTEKLGIGVNIQERLHLLTHMDAPVRPSDYQQRNGRIIRQGNMHLEMDKPVRILRLGVKQTLDVTGYQRLEIKKKFIDQIMKGDTTQRSIEETDLDSSDSNNFAQMMATLSGSQAALAYSVEQNKLRKLENAKTYHEQNQIYISGQINRNENIIQTTSGAIEQLKKEKSETEKIFPDKKIVSVKIGKTEAKTEAEIDTLLANTINKRIEENVELLRKDFSREDMLLKTEILINNRKFDVSVAINRKYDIEKKSTRVTRIITYKCVDLPRLEGDSGAKVENMLRNVNEYISGVQFDERIKERELGVEKAKNNNAFYKPQLGQPFSKEEELKKGLKRVAELEVQMKDELQEIEVQEASENIEEVDISNAVVEDDGAGDVRLREEEVEEPQPDRLSRLQDNVVFKLHAQMLADKLHSPVEFVSSRDQPQGRKNAKGFFDGRTGKISIVLDNHTSLEDVRRTVFHEAVAHRGLRGLYGNDFNQFLDRVFADVSKEEREKIVNMAGRNGWNTRVATEEYIAVLAENGFENDSERTSWQKIKKAFVDMLSALKMKLGFVLTDNDLRYVLWKSYQKLQGDSDIISKAEDMVMRGHFGIGAKEKENSEIRYRDEAEQVEISAQQEYEKSFGESKRKALAYKLQEAYQDSMLGLKNLQEAVVKETGEPLEDYENAYMAENQSSSKSTYEAEFYRNNYFSPMVNAVSALVRKGCSYDSVIEYMLAKHGLERNEVFAMRDAERKANEDVQVVNDLLKAGKMSQEKYDNTLAGIEKKKNDYYLENRKNDYSGLTQLTAQAIEDAGLDEDAYEGIARQMVADLETGNEAEVEELWKRVNDATKQTLKKSYESGMMSRSTYDNLKTMFDYYVPLRGWKDDIASDVYEYILTERSTFNAPVKAAKGRKSQADDPIATIGNMAESAILQGNKNLVKQKFLNMALNRPTSLVTVTNMWYVKVEGVDEWEQSMPEMLPGATADEVAQIVYEHEGLMKALEEKGLAKKSADGLKLKYRASKREQSEHSVIVKRCGKEYVLYVNGNPRASQAVNGLTNDEASENKSKQTIGKMNRWLAANFTTRNPAFVVTNLSRDLIFGASAVAVKEDGAYMRRYLQNLAKSPKTIVQCLSGNVDINNPVHRYFKEFLENGGETGYTALHNVDQYRKIIARQIAGAKGKADLGGMFGLEPGKYTSGVAMPLVNGLQSFAKGVNFMNRCAEDVSRFNTFMTSRQMGRSIQRSISDAKEITVNFNKKGAGGYGATTFKTLYLFFNAAVQSLNNFYKLGKKSPRKLSSLVGSFAAAGFVVPLMNALLMAMWGDEDDKDKYNNLPEWVRRNNLCLWLGGDKFLTVPIPIELRAFYGMGEMAYQWTKGNMHHKNVGYEMMNQITELLPVNPVGNNGDMLGSFIPDMVKPFYQILVNEDFFGKPVYKKNDFNENMPEYTKAYAGTSKFLVKSTGLLNEITGGDKYTKGTIDVNPAKIEHVFEGYFGGMGKTIVQTGKLIGAIFDEDQRVLRNYPIVNRFLSETDERNAYSRVNEEYFHYLDEYERTCQRIKGYEKETTGGSLDYAEKLNFLYFSPEMKRYQYFKAYQPSIKELQESVKNAPDNEAKKKYENILILLKIELTELLDGLEEEEKKTN